MARGFFHPVIGYFETNVDTVDLAKQPPGTVEVGLRPTPDHKYVGGTWTHSPTIKTPAELRQERLDTVLRPWQFKAALKLFGIEAIIAQKMSELPTATERAVALAKLEGADGYHRTDSLFTGPLPASIGLTQKDIDDMWEQAAQFV